MLYNMIGYSVVYYMGGDLLVESNEVNENYGNIKKESIVEEFVLMKTPASKPDQSNWNAMESVNQEIEKAHGFYQVVEQKMLNDTLYTVCKVGRNARDNFFALVDHINKHVKNDDSDTHRKSSSFLKNFLKEYISLNKKHVIYVLEWLTPKSFSAYLYPHFTPHFTIISPPPRF
ncbi:hypothetical protein [Pseudarcicella hirudinis]